MLKLSQNALGMLIAKYRAVLKNMRLKAPALLAACCLLALAPAPAAADYIEYKGTGWLQAAPDWFNAMPNSLFPGTKDKPGYAGNTVVVDYTPDGILTNPDVVFGGLSYDNNVTGNSVTMKNGLVVFVVCGGLSYYGDATHNSVTVEGGTMAGIIGGESDFRDAFYNNVNISGSATVGEVYGGFGYTATNNSVTISGDATVDGSGFSDVYGDVYGGFGYTAANNSVTISGNAKVNRLVIGGSGYVAANNNIVTISDNVEVGTVYGGMGLDTAANNSVTISGGTAMVISGGTAINTATSNSVTVSGNTTVDYNVNGGTADNAANNSVTIEGGTVGSVYGGMGINAATHNNVTISGGTARYVSGGSGNTATNNSVTISGSPILASSDLYGGDNNGSASNDIFTGNTLNVYIYKGAGVNSINNFQNYDFYLPASMNYANSVLEVVNWINPTDSGGITVKGIGIEGGGTPLAVGNKVNLITSTETFPTNSLSETNINGLKGVSLLYNFKLDMNDINPNTLTAKVTGVEANPQAKALSEGRAATMGFLNHGADLSVGRGIADALNKTAQAGSEKTAFGAFSFGPARYNTGSHADVNGVSLLSGIAWKTETAKATLLKGIFLEGGLGNYNTYNSFTNASVSTYGDTNYYGLGALIRRDAASGNYAEGSLRAGRSRTELSGGDLKDYIGQTATYTSSPAYYGAHLGIGRAKTKGDKTVDYYAKYFWTHQNGDNVTILGDTFSFAASDSHRLRGGARLTKEKSGGRIATYAGLAYEYEFDGKAKASVHGFDIDAPSLKGGTGIVELGMSYKTHADSMNTLSLSLQGYAGKRQGLTGSVQLKRVF